jgi:quercetin dioxygenase-like cupin family protein
MSEHLVEDPVGRQRYVFRPSPEGDVLHIEGWVDPGGGVPPHIHPDQEERFEILEGEMTFTVGREKRPTGPGGVALVPPGTRHAFQNAGDVTVHMRVETRPPHDLQAFLEDVAALGRAGHTRRIGKNVVPKGYDGLLRGAVLFRAYREHTLILLPPPFFQRLVLDRLAAIGERRGYRPGNLA